MIKREAFFAANRTEIREVAVPALGGSVFVRVITAGERDAFEAASNAEKIPTFRARLVQLCACDENGARVFEPADVPSLSTLPAKVLDPIVKAAIEVNAMGADAVEDAAKNSEGGPA